MRSRLLGAPWAAALRPGVARHGQHPRDARRRRAHPRHAQCTCGCLELHRQAAAQRSAPPGLPGGASTPTPPRGSCPDRMSAPAPTQAASHNSAAEGGTGLDHPWTYASPGLCRKHRGGHDSFDVAQLRPAVPARAWRFDFAARRRKDALERIRSCRGRLGCASDAPHIDGAVVDGGKEVERSTMVVPTRRPE